MVDNLFLGPDAQARLNLQTLRRHSADGKISGERTPVLDDVFLSNDPEAGITGDYSCTDTTLIRVQSRPPGQATPRWQGMHIAMGPASLENAAVIGVVARSQAPSSATTRLCIRSGRDGRFVDTFFPNRMVSFAQPSTHLDILETVSTPDLPRQAAWRELILFFRTGEVDLELLDLRLFVL